MQIAGDIVEYWTVAWTEPNAEKKADISLREKGYATFLPFERVRKTRPVRGRPGQTVTSWEPTPIYPRYIFIGVPPKVDTFAASEARGISHILHFGDGVVRVPHGVVEEIMLTANSDGVVEHRDLTKRKEFKPGDRVSFAEDSPLSGFIFLVKQDAGKKAKVWIESLDGKKMHVDPGMLHGV
jgi:hypothetical protein